MSIVLIILGGVLLYFGGELLVTHSARLARIWGLSPLTIGLTVVAFGTSSPELAASVTAAFRGAPSIAIGNVIGSNISNIAFILGVSAMIYPIAVQKRFNRREMPFMIAASALIWPLFFNGLLGRIEGLILIALLAGYTFVVLRFSTQAAAEIIPELDAIPDEPEGPAWKSLLGAALGIGLLVGGAQSLIEGAVRIATQLGVPDKVIGLTLVAFGTSLPEFASCAVASMRKHSEIVLGNIVGSNIFNVLCILGFTAVIKPLAIPWSEILIDFGVMMAFSVILWPMLITGKSLGRLEGACLFAGYVAYIVYLFAGVNSPAPAM
ncbi:MAG: calcium/sodium antiporter [bacterium]|nr:calcium/sodium antiporter [bacterium]